MRSNLKMKHQQIEYQPVPYAQEQLQVVNAGYPILVQQAQTFDQRMPPQDYFQSNSQQNFNMINSGSYEMVSPGHVIPDQMYHQQQQQAMQPVLVQNMPPNKVPVEQQQVIPVVIARQASPMRDNSNATAQVFRNMNFQHSMPHNVQNEFQQKQAPQQYALTSGFPSTFSQQSSVRGVGTGLQPAGESQIHYMSQMPSNLVTQQSKSHLQSSHYNPLGSTDYCQKQMPSQNVSQQQTSKHSLSYAYNSSGDLIMPKQAEVVSPQIVVQQEHSHVKPDAFQTFSPPPVDQPISQPTMDINSLQQQPVRDQCLTSLNQAEQQRSHSQKHAPQTIPVKQTPMRGESVPSYSKQTPFQKVDNQIVGNHLLNYEYNQLPQTTTPSNIHSKPYDSFTNTAQGTLQGTILSKDKDSSIRPYQPNLMTSGSKEDLFSNDQSLRYDSQHRQLKIVENTLENRKGSEQILQAIRASRDHSPANSRPQSSIKRFNEQRYGAASSFDQQEKDNKYLRYLQRTSNTVSESRIPVREHSDKELRTQAPSDLREIRSRSTCAVTPATFSEEKRSKSVVNVKQYCINKMIGRLNTSEEFRKTMESDTERSRPTQRTNQYSLNEYRYRLDTQKSKEGRPPRPNYDFKKSERHEPRYDHTMSSAMNAHPHSFEHTTKVLSLAQTATASLFENTEQQLQIRQVQAKDGYTQSDFATTGTSIRMPQTWEGTKQSVQIPPEPQMSSSGIGSRRMDGQHLTSGFSNPHGASIFTLGNIDSINNNFAQADFNSQHRDKFYSFQGSNVTSNGKPPVARGEYSVEKRNHEDSSKRTEPRMTQAERASQAYLECLQAERNTEKRSVEMPTFEANNFSDKPQSRKEGLSEQSFVKQHDLTSSFLRDQLINEKSMSRSRDCSADDKPYFDSQNQPSRTGVSSQISKRYVDTSSRNQSSNVSAYVQTTGARHTSSFHVLPDPEAIKKAEHDLRQREKKIRRERRKQRKAERMAKSSTPLMNTITQPTPPAHTQEDTGIVSMPQIIDESQINHQERRVRKYHDMASSLKSSLTQTEEFTNYLARSTSIMDSETIQDQESYLKSRYERHSRTRRELKKLYQIQKKHSKMLKELMKNGDTLVQQEKENEEFTTAAIFTQMQVIFQNLQAIQNQLNEDKKAVSAKTAPGSRKLKRKQSQPLEVSRDGQKQYFGGTEDNNQTGDVSSIVTSHRVSKMEPGQPHLAKHKREGPNPYEHAHQSSSAFDEFQDGESMLVHSQLHSQPQRVDQQSPYTPQQFLIDQYQQQVSCKESTIPVDPRNHKDSTMTQNWHPNYSQPSQYMEEAQTTQEDNHEDQDTQEDQVSSLVGGGQIMNTQDNKTSGKDTLSMKNTATVTMDYSNNQSAHKSSIYNNSLPNNVGSTVMWSSQLQTDQLCDLLTAEIDKIRAESLGQVEQMRQQYEREMQQLRQEFQTQLAQQKSAAKSAFTGTLGCDSNSQPTSYMPSKQMSSANMLKTGTAFVTSEPEVQSSITTSQVVNQRIYEELQSVKAQRDLYHDKLMKVKAKLTMNSKPVRRASTPMAQSIGFSKPQMSAGQTSSGQYTMAQSQTVSNNASQTITYQFTQPDDQSVASKPSRQKSTVQHKVLKPKIVDSENISQNVSQRESGQQSCNEQYDCKPPRQEPRNYIKLQKQVDPAEAMTKESSVNYLIPQKQPRKNMPSDSSIPAKSFPITNAQNSTRNSGLPVKERAPLIDTTNLPDFQRQAHSMVQSPYNQTGELKLSTLSKQSAGKNHAKLKSIISNDSSQASFQQANVAGNAKRWQRDCGACNSKNATVETDKILEGTFSEPQNQKIYTMMKQSAETQKTEVTASSHKIEAMSFNDSNSVLPANQENVALTTKEREINDRIHRIENFLQTQGL